MERILSGLIYLTMFAISCGLFYLSDRVKVTSSLSSSALSSDFVVKKLILILAILLPCLLAGLRADSVGVDVETYIVPHMRTASYCDSFLEFCNRMSHSSEYLYLFLVYICSRFTFDAGLLLFFLQLFTVVPIVMAVTKMKNSISLPMAMATYYFCFYNNSLNMMRQSVSVSLVILGCVYLMKKHARPSIKAIICYVLALFFHKSAFIGIICVAIVIVVSYAKILKCVKPFIYACIIAIPFVATAIFETLNSWGILSDNFSLYADIFLYRTFDKDYFVNPFSMRILTDVFFRLALVVLPYLYYRRSKDISHGVHIKNGKLIISNSRKELSHSVGIYALEYECLLTLVTCGFLIYIIILFSMNTVYGGRISYYFDLFVAILVPYSTINVNKNKKYGYIVIMFIYWVLWVMIYGWSGSNIYEFRI